MQTQLVEDQARLNEMNQELNAAQAKAIPEIERRTDALHGKVRSSLKDRAIVAQGMLNAIHDADLT